MAPREWYVGEVAKGQVKKLWEAEVKELKGELTELEEEATEEPHQVVEEQVRDRSAELTEGEAQRKAKGEIDEGAEEKDETQKKPRARGGEDVQHEIIVKKRTLSLYA